MNIISHANGRTALEIAAASGFRRSVVRNALSRYMKNGLVTRRLLPGQKVIYAYYVTDKGLKESVKEVRHRSRVDTNKILKLKDKGLSCIKIAEKIGCDRTTVYDHLKKTSLKSTEQKPQSTEDQLIALCNGKRTLNDISSLSNLDYKLVGQTLNKAWKEKKVSLSWRGSRKIYGPVSQHIPDDNLFGGIDVLSLCDGKTTVKELAIKYNLNYTKLSNYLNWAVIKGLLKVRSTPVGNFYYGV